jgi:hypothetical protein
MKNICKINVTVWQKSTKFWRFEMCIKFGKPKAKRPLDRLRHGWGIILNLKKWVEDVGWIHLGQVVDK